MRVVITRAGLAGNSTCSCRIAANARGSMLPWRLHAGINERVSPGCGPALRIPWGTSALRNPGSPSRMLKKERAVRYKYRYTDPM